jgi:hypothetical protein
VRSSTLTTHIIERPIPLAVRQAVEVPQNPSLIRTAHAVEAQLMLLGKRLKDGLLFISQLREAFPSVEQDPMLPLAVRSDP